MGALRVRQIMRYHSPKPLEVYVIWHPDCHEATSIAGQVKNHFGTHRFQNVMGGRGINMKFLRISDFGSSIPIHAEFPAVAVALIDGLFVEDNNYLEGLKILGEKIEKRAFRLKCERNCKFKEFSYHTW